MADAQNLEGGCLCGAVRWRATGQPLHSAHCHCRQCQRQSGAIFITGVLYPYEAVKWTSEEPDFYRSSESAKRGFCSRCGSWLSWHWLDEKIMMTVGSFDHPEEALEQECIQRVGDYAAVTDYGHEVCVTRPSRNDVGMQMSGQPRSGASAKVVTDVESLRRQCISEYTDRVANRAGHFHQLVLA